MKPILEQSAPMQAQSDGLSKELLGRVPVKLSYTVIDDDGNEREHGCKIVLRRRTFDEIRAEARDQAAAEEKGETLDEPRPAERIAQLIIAEPEGFTDFPTDERPVPERAREYFSDPVMEAIGDQIVGRYVALSYPRELFRSR
ncbi:MAG: hypothetical protein L0229_00245 [Blastocatellia bacterium]|nr:hypothetical protein [Blastocatellia bacterium]